MKNILATPFVLLALIISFPTVKGQQFHDLVGAAEAFSDSLTGKDQQLYNGRIFTPEHPRASGHPFLGSGEWIAGKVIYSEQSYEPVELLYDIYRDQLLLHDQSPDGSVNYLVLNPEMADRFWLDDRTFINLGYQSRVTSNNDFGYYEILYEGKASLVIRWSKGFDDSRNQQTPFGEYREEKRNRYIWKDNRLYRFGNRNALLRILDEKQGILREYLSTNDINVALATDEEIITVLRRYNELSE